MRTRVALTLAAVLAVALAGTSSVRAADPNDRIGGALSATPTKVTLTSQGTVPVDVTMKPSGPFTVTPDVFRLDPGQTVALSVSGTPSGTISATLRPLAEASVGDTAALTLEVAMPAPATDAPDWRWALYLVLAAATIVVVLRRLRPWEYRVERRRR